MKILVTGGSGRLGHELLKVYPDALHPTRKELDVTSPTSVSTYLSETKPDVVIHAAALTNVQLCEDDKKAAYENNVQGTANLVDALTKIKPDSYLVLISTACVFQGDRGNYTEKDAPKPKNYYGFTKKSAEDIVLKSPLKHLVVRTNFVAFAPWEHPKAFADRFGTYLFAQDVAFAVKELIAKDLVGIVHICGDKRLSMYELAKLTTPNVQPMTLEDYHGSAQLTVDMTLCSTKIKPYKIGWSINAHK